MTISTEKMVLPLGAAFCVLCALGGGAPEAQANDFQLKPTISLSEEFNDNVYESVSDKRRDFITRAQPGVALLYSAPSLNADLAYNFDYRYYAQGSKSDEKDHHLLLNGSAAVTEKFFFIDVSDTLQRVSLSVARDVTSESLFLNQSDQNVATVSPYLLWHLGEKTVLKTGYSFIDTRYWSSAGIDKQQNRLAADLSHQSSSRLSFTAGYAFSRINTAINSYDEHDISSGVRYEYDDKSFLFGGVGNSWLAFSDSRRASNLFWNAGVTNDFGFLVGSLETRVQYTEDPLTSSPIKQTSYSANVSKTVPQGGFGLAASYSDFTATAVGAAEQRKLSFSGFGHYDLTQRLSTNVSATCDRVRGAVDFPYHFNGSAGASYGFNYDVTAALTYSRVEYRHALDSAAGASQTNRVVLDVKKVF